MDRHNKNNLYRDAINLKKKLIKKDILEGDDLMIDRYIRGYHYIKLELFIIWGNKRLKIYNLYEEKNEVRALYKQVKQNQRDMEGYERLERYEAVLQSSEKLLVKYRERFIEIKKKIEELNEYDIYDDEEFGMIVNDKSSRKQKKEHYELHMKVQKKLELLSEMRQYELIASSNVQKFINNMPVSVQDFEDDIMLMHEFLGYVDCFLGV